MNMHATIPSADGAVTRGHNQPPGLIALARETYRALSAWLAETPVIQSFDDAKAAGKWIETVSASLDDLDAERRSQVEPLNRQVKEINDLYRPVREAFTNDARRGLLDETKRRLTAYSAAEEARKAAEAERLRKAAEEAERQAHEAERIEADAKAAADVGECGVDVGEAIAQADEAFADFVAVNRMAARAERDIKTRIGSSFGGRAIGLRNKETLTVTDAAAALAAIGLTEKITDALISAARDYRKLKGELPPGISSTKERSL